MSSLFNMSFCGASPVGAEDVFTGNESVRDESSMSIDELKEVFEKAGQGHVFTGFESLPSDQQQSLIADLRRFSVDEVNTAFKTVNLPPKDETFLPSPILRFNEDRKDLRFPMEASKTKCFVTRAEDVPVFIRDAWYNEGLRLILGRKVAGLIMAGGQGTRLGFNKPKGMFPAGPISRKPLFQLFCERMRKVQQLAELRMPRDVVVSALKAIARQPPTLLDTTCEVVCGSTGLTGGSGGANASKKRKLGTAPLPDVVVSPSAGGASSSSSLLHPDDPELQALSENARGLPLVVMCNEETLAEIRDFFAEHDHFGMHKEDIIFFAQPVVPAVDRHTGKILLSSEGKVALAPNGNGGLFSALEKSGVAARLEALGVDALHVVSVDNALCKILDPAFIGFCSAANVQAGNKCVEKHDPAEKVGVMALKCPKAADGSPIIAQASAAVIEYSELTDQQRHLRLDGALLQQQNTANGGNLTGGSAGASGRDNSAAGGASPTTSGPLAFSAASVANHYFKLSLAREVGAKSLLQGRYHRADKAVSFFDFKTRQIVRPETPNAIKVEMFIFDAFEYADRVACLLVDRREEFAPIKNRSGPDSPESAAAMMSRLHRVWITCAGGAVVAQGAASHTPSAEAEAFAAAATAHGAVLPPIEDNSLEVSPLVSYEGEDLGRWLPATRLKLPLYIDLDNRGTLNESSANAMTAPAADNV